MTDTTPNRAPLVLGFLFAGAALLGLGMCTRGLQQRAPQSAPELTLIAPVARDTVSDSLVVRFRTAAPLALTRHGWAAGDLHPHILLDGTEHMAAAADIRVEGDSFAWRLPAPGPGDHSLLLTWAGMSHGTVGDTTGRRVHFHFRPTR